MLKFRKTCLILGCLTATLAAPAFAGVEMGEYETAGMKLKFLKSVPLLGKAVKRPVWIFQEGDGSVSRTGIDFKWPRTVSTYLSNRYGVMVVWPELRRQAVSVRADAYCELDFFHRIDDLSALIEAIKQDPRVDSSQIVLIGESAGSEVVTLTANRVSDVAAVVTMGGGVIEIAEALKRSGEWGKVVDLLDNQCVEGRYDSRSGKFWQQLFYSGLYEAVTKVRVPYFAMIGAADPITRYQDQVSELAAAQLTNPHFSYRIVPGSEHGFSYRLDRWQTMVEWLRARGVAP